MKALRVPLFVTLCATALLLTQCGPVGRSVSKVSLSKSDATPPKALQKNLDESPVAFNDWTEVEVTWATADASTKTESLSETQLSDILSGDEVQKDSVERSVEQVRLDISTHDLSAEEISKVEKENKIRFEAKRLVTEDREIIRIRLKNRSSKSKAWLNEHVHAVRITLIEKKSD